MSGQGNLFDFEVAGATDDAMGATIIAGIPIATGVPTDGQYIKYVDADKQWQYGTLPISTVYAAVGTTTQTLTASTDVPFATDVIVSGTDIVRASPATFTVQPGLYRLQFQATNFAWTSTGVGDLTPYQFYDATAAASIGPIGQAISGASTGSTGSVSMEAVVRFTVASTISLRIGTPVGTAPTAANPQIFIYKLN